LSAGYRKLDIPVFQPVTDGSSIWRGGRREAQQIYCVTSVRFSY